MIFKQLNIISFRGNAAGLSTSLSLTAIEQIVNSEVSRLITEFLFKIITKYLLMRYI